MSLQPAAGSTIVLALRCFRCLDKGHRAANCRDPVWCFRCFRSGGVGCQPMPLPSACLPRCVAPGGVCPYQSVESTTTVAEFTRIYRLNATTYSQHTHITIHGTLSAMNDRACSPRRRNLSRNQTQEGKKGTPSCSSILSRRRRGAPGGRARCGSRRGSSWSRGARTCGAARRRGRRARRRRRRRPPAGCAGAAARG